MPSAVPSQSGGPSARRPTPANAPPRAHPTRMPAATSSLRVQLPPGEFLDSFSSFGNNVEARSRTQTLVPASAAVSAPSTAGSASASAAAGDARPPNVPPPPQVSDATLLAQGILEQQRKAKEILAWQQRLMEDRRISREELKRGLTRLSTPYWLQILQERAIYQLCGYPGCTSRLSSAAGSSSSATPRFRISVSRRTIERDTSDDPGGRNNFCSQTCYARSEWVRRWVLDPFSRSGPSDTSARAGGDRTLARGNPLEDPIAAQMRRVGEEQALQGGKWEALTNLREDQWAEIELLEDMEEQGDLDRWEGFGSSGRGGSAGVNDGAGGSSAASQPRPPTQMHIRNGMGSVLPVSEIVTERKRPSPQAPAAKRQTLARPAPSRSGATGSSPPRPSPGPVSPTRAQRGPPQSAVSTTASKDTTASAESGDAGDAEGSLPSRLGSLTISERSTSTRNAGPSRDTTQTPAAESSSPPAQSPPRPTPASGAPRRARMAPSAFKTGGDDALDLDGGGRRGAAADDVGDDEDGDGFFSLGSTASLTRQIRDASGRLTRAIGAPAAGGGGAMDVEGADGGDAVEVEREEDEETRKKREEERRLLEEGMRLLEEMRGKGEME